MQTEATASSTYLVEIANKSYPQSIFTDSDQSDLHHDIVKSAIDSGIRIGRCKCIQGKGVKITLRKSDIRRNHVMVPESSWAEHDKDCLLKNRNIAAIDSNIIADYIEIDGNVEIFSPIKLVAELEPEISLCNTGIPGIYDKTNQPNKAIRAGLSGIFYSLIDIGKLNKHSFGKIQNKINFSIAMQQASSNVLINGIRLSNSLHIPGSGLDSQNQCDHIFPSTSKFHQSLVDESELDGNQHRGIVFGTISSINVSEGTCNIKCLDIDHIFKITSSKYNSLNKSYSPALSKVGSSLCNVMAVMLVSPSDKGQLSVLDIEIVLTDCRFIPMDSFPEVCLADELVSRGYDFIKPLKRGRDGQIVADFIIKIGDIIIYIELWGMCTTAYIADRMEKVFKYKKLGLELVEYDHVNKQTIESFFVNLQERIRTLVMLQKALHCVQN
jgi:hypothetical protein